MSEQLELNLSPRAEEPGYERMNLDELKALYREKIGVPARLGRDERAHLIWAIENPEKELRQLRAEDTDADKVDLYAPYKH